MEKLVIFPMVKIQLWTSDHRLITARPNKWGKKAGKDIGKGAKKVGKDIGKAFKKF